MQNEDFLVRLGKAESRDRHAEMPVYTPNMSERQKHIYYSRSAREPAWTGQANQPVGGRAQRKWAMKHEPPPWTAREERAYQAAFGRSWASQRGHEQRLAALALEHLPHQQVHPLGSVPGSWGKSHAGRGSE